MFSARELLAEVDASFDAMRHGLADWPDPHPDRVVLDELYSRVTDAAKWRIVGARADAWVSVLSEAGLASVAPAPALRWLSPRSPTLLRVVRVRPHAPGAMQLIVARSRVGDLPDAGVTLGVGDPAVRIALIPDCGCDACDSGSQDVLDEVDQYILRVVRGERRRLWSVGNREIVVTEGGRGTSGVFADGEIDAILADPTGWLDYSGTSWSTD